jgi:hypothetical protein
MRTPGAPSFSLFRVVRGAGDRPVRREDWTRVLRRALAEASTDPLGGSGGGVQVLTVMEARSRSFAALRVIGLNRGVFPRRISEDPLLPDALRRALRDVLPDLPIKSEGHEEERFLFAQLVAAAPEVPPLVRAARRDRPRRFAVAAVRAHTGRDRGVGARAALAARSRARDRALPLARRVRRRRCPTRSRMRGALRLRRVPRRSPTRGSRCCASSIRATRAATSSGRSSARRPAARRRRSAARAAVRDAARAHRELSVAVVPVADPRHRARPDARGVLPGAGDKRLLGNVVHGALALAATTSEWPHSFARELLLEPRASRRRRRASRCPASRTRSRAARRRTSRWRAGSTRPRTRSS